MAKSVWLLFMKKKNEKSNVANQNFFASIRMCNSSQYLSNFISMLENVMEFLSAPAQEVVFYAHASLAFNCIVNGMRASYNEVH